MDTIRVITGQPVPAGPPTVPGRPAVLVPYYAAVEKECDEGLRGVGLAGVQVRRASFSAIDLLRCVMLSQALRDGFDRFLFIDADIGFDPADALRLLARPEPVVAGIYMKKTGRDYSGAFAAGVDRVVFGPGGAGPLSDALRLDRLPAHPRRGPAPDDRRAEAAPLPLGAGQGVLPVLPAALRARRPRRDPLPHRGLQLLPPPPADRHHPDGRHDHQALPLRQVRIQLRGPQPPARGSSTAPSTSTTPRARTGRDEDRSTAQTTGPLAWADADCPG